MEISQELAQILLCWYQDARRALPWRIDRNPYHIWLSEIMCQQTRVEAVKGYYSRFLDVLPDIASLAGCPQDRLNKLWEGLGYYSRVKNMKRAAEMILAEHGGVFPSDYQQVRALPGIGDYTAAAICSICYDQPYPAVDGNVLRVITRLLGLELDISLPDTKKQVRSVLQPLFQGGHCGDLNQALMELGALVCLPNGTPDCAHCPLLDSCKSGSTELWKILPMKKPRVTRKVLHRTVFILRHDDTYALQKRPDSGLLAGLWELPAMDGDFDVNSAWRQAEDWQCKPHELLRHADKKHVFTHLEWKMRGYYLDCDAASSSFIWASANEILQFYSLPTAYRQFLDEI